MVGCHVQLLKALLIQNPAIQIRAAQLVVLERGASGRLAPNLVEVENHSVFTCLSMNQNAGVHRVHPNSQKLFRAIPTCVQNLASVTGRNGRSALVRVDPFRSTNDFM